jgi:hypothetical protein
MSIFDRLDRMTSRVADRMHAVAFTLRPSLRSPTGRGVPDPERGEIVGKGIFDQAYSHTPLESGNRDRQGNDFRTLASGNRYEMSIDVDRHPGVRSARQGDELTLDEVRRFDVISVQPDGLSRVVLRLAAI